MISRTSNGSLTDQSGIVDRHPLFGLIDDAVEEGSVVAGDDERPRPVVEEVLQRPQGVEVDLLCGRLVRGEAHVGHFGIRVGAPRQKGVIGFPGKMENGIADHNPPFVSGSMRKLKSATHIAGRENVLLTGPEAVVHKDTAAVEIHPDGLEVEVVHIG